MSGTPLHVPLIATVDVAAWMDEYPTIGSRAEAITDIEDAAAVVFRDWLRNHVGLKAADVRVDR